MAKGRVRYSGWLLTSDRQNGVLPILTNWIIRGIQLIQVLTTMKGETAERWYKLCEQAANEQDPQKLMELIHEIDRLLAEKEERLVRQQQPGKEAAKEKGAA